MGRLSAAAPSIRQDPEVEVHVSPCRWSARSVPSRQARWRAAPPQKPPIASAETPHRLRHLWPMTPSTPGKSRIAASETVTEHAHKAPNRKNHAQNRYRIHD